jgi:hypothetical protein
VTAVSEFDVDYRSVLDLPWHTMKH